MSSTGYVCHTGISVQHALRCTKQLHARTGITGFYCKHTVWDESITLDGKIGEYIVTARRHGNTWYVGGMTNWDARDIEVDLSFLKEKGKTVTLFKDGINAHRSGRDYKKENIKLNDKDKVKIHLAPGGGFAMKIE